MVLHLGLLNQRQSSGSSPLEVSTSFGPVWRNVGVFDSISSSGAAAGRDEDDVFPTARFLRDSTTAVLTVKLPESPLIVPSSSGGLLSALATTAASTGMNSSSRSRVSSPTEQRHLQLQHQSQQCSSGKSSPAITPPSSPKSSSPPPPPSGPSGTSTSSAVVPPRTPSSPVFRQPSPPSPPPTSPAASSNSNVAPVARFTFTQILSNSHSSFTFATPSSAALTFPSSLPPRPGQYTQTKRARPASDVDGPFTCTLPSKKRRLRLQRNCSSRLSAPFSYPASHVLAREAVAGPGDTKRFLKLAAFLAARRAQAVANANAQQLVYQQQQQQQQEEQAQAQQGREDQPARPGSSAGLRQQRPPQQKPQQTTVLPLRIPDASAESVLRRAACLNSLRIRLHHDSEDEDVDADMDEDDDLLHSDELSRLDHESHRRPAPPSPRPAAAMPPLGLASVAHDEDASLRETLLRHAGQQLAVGARFFPSPSEAPPAPVLGPRSTAFAAAASVNAAAPWSSAAQQRGVPAAGRYAPSVRSNTGYASPSSSATGLGSASFVPPQSYPHAGPAPPSSLHHHPHPSQAQHHQQNQAQLHLQAHQAAQNSQHLHHHLGGHHHHHHHHHHPHHVALLPLARQAQARLSPSPPTSPSLRPVVDGAPGSGLLPLPPTPRLRPLPSPELRPSRPAASGGAVSPVASRASSVRARQTRNDDDNDDVEELDGGIAFPTSEHESRYEAEGCDEDALAAGDVYADFGLIFGGGGGAADDEDLDPALDDTEHFYEEYLDELDGLNVGRAW